MQVFDLPWFLDVTSLQACSFRLGLSTSSAQFTSSHFGQLQAQVFWMLPKMMISTHGLLILFEEIRWTPGTMSTWIDEEMKGEDGSIQM